VGARLSCQGCWRMKIIAGSRAGRFPGWVSCLVAV